MNVTEFLLARIAEDEAMARAGCSHTSGGSFATDRYGSLIVQPARVLAECEAKRVAVRFYLDDDPTVMGATLEAMAAIYSDHPDYQQEWA